MKLPPSRTSRRAAATGFSTPQLRYNATCVILASDERTICSFVQAFPNFLQTVATISLA